jgi:uncharacterized membrane protein
MTLLIIGVSIFIGIHLLPSIVPLRNALYEGLGEKAYKGVYSLLALTGLGLIIYGKAYAEYVPVWNPLEWSRYVAWGAMVPALILIVAANVPGNIKRFTPHPMMWSVLIWAGAHLFANGDQASIILFGSFGAFAIFDILSANLRGALKQTKVLPFSSDIKIIAMGLATYVVFAGAHSFLFKVNPFVM